MQAETTSTTRGGGRVSVDLSGYPDLVVVYLGFRVTTWRGLKALLGIGRKLGDLTREKPDGLLAHESVLYALNHVGMRQYWRDFESLEAFTRSEPHKGWWSSFAKDPAGSGFWHETYRRSGGMEAIYLGMPKPIGLGSFAAARAPVGPFMSARGRIAV
ncbi:DUF4188 domain-containing protein [Methylobacterium haplocladii]|uniref:Transcriptional regulator n=1 Tax=Methylobacterium haplocladii TaxID=1176176 RepID=A0A512ISN8_9HYPH|nr:DUF4188 domain-containing protein [Methylobacterium haplocladii]GEP00720.1 transcriptional regulator [Methylobacterium haplocladii]GJD82413.1 hypothetical protein HPGCJGGD_0267 [Methylobacterium haplocladii]GLS59553.1 transcriptional regulator [Methylobacterium haplocladii]